MQLPIFLPTRSRRLLSTLLLGTALSVLASGCTVFGVGSVEEAPYELVREEGRFEIRDYAPVVVAQTRVEAGYEEAGGKAFRRLFAYISGENESGDEIAMTAPVIAEGDADASGEKIAMTAPVTSERDGDAWRYRFVLPRSYSLDSAPRPLNEEVTLTEREPARAAVVRYSGRSTGAARAENADALAEWIESQGLEARSEPRWAGYDPPWTLPPFRRNEVMVDIAGP